MRRGEPRLLPYDPNVCGRREFHGHSILNPGCQLSSFDGGLTSYQSRPRPHLSASDGSEINDAFSVFTRTRPARPRPSPPDHPGALDPP